MKKFKEFQIVTPNKDCFDCCAKYILSLGYIDGSSLYDGYNYGIGAANTGESFSLAGKYKANDRDIPVLTLDEFFKLTPKDVVIKPKRFSCHFKTHNHDGFISAEKYRDLTQDQIDEIKAIMERKS